MALHSAPGIIANDAQSAAEVRHRLAVQLELVPLQGEHSLVGPSASAAVIKSCTGLSSPCLKKNNKLEYCI